MAYSIPDFLLTEEHISVMKENISMVPLFTKKNISDSYKIKTIFCYKMLRSYNDTNMYGKC